MRDTCAGSWTGTCWRYACWHTPIFDNESCRTAFWTPSITRERTPHSILVEAELIITYIELQLLYYSFKASSTLSARKKSTSKGLTSKGFQEYTHRIRDQGDRYFEVPHFPISGPGERSTIKGFHEDTHGIREQGDILRVVWS